MIRTAIVTVLLASLALPASAHPHIFVDAQATITFNDAVESADTPNHSGQIDVQSLSDALDALDKLDSRKADVVRMRVVWGMPHEAIAEALEISIPTVERDWRFARAWLANAVASPSNDANAAEA